MHVWVAAIGGAGIAILPILLAIFRPGATITRHVIAASQLLMSALLIHLTGGRIETHFHVFGSLAFLAFYKDWRGVGAAAGGGGGGPLPPRPFLARSGGGPPPGGPRRGGGGARGGGVLAPF